MSGIVLAGSIALLAACGGKDGDGSVNDQASVVAQSPALGAANVDNGSPHTFTLDKPVTALALTFMAGPSHTAGMATVGQASSLDGKTWTLSSVRWAGPGKQVDVVVGTAQNPLTHTVINVRGALFGYTLK